MERSHGALHRNAGSCWSSHPMQFHSGIAHMPLGSLIEPLICEEAFHCDCWNYNVDFKFMVDMMTKQTIKQHTYAKKQKKNT